MYKINWYIKSYVQDTALSSGLQIGLQSIVT